MARGAGGGQAPSGWRTGGALGIDRSWLRATIQRHRDETGSPVAGRILADFGAAPFVKVFPKDFKRVLAAMRRAEQEGLDVDKVVMEAAHG